MQPSPSLCMSPRWGEASGDCTCPPHPASGGCSLCGCASPCPRAPLVPRLPALSLTQADKSHFQDGLIQFSTNSLLDPVTYTAPQLEPRALRRPPQPPRRAVPVLGWGAFLAGIAP